MLKSLHTERHRIFCESLQRARKSAGLTQTGLAGRLGEHQSFVSRYEGGQRRLDIVEFIEVCRALGVKPTRHLSAFLAELGRRGKTRGRKP